MNPDPLLSGKVYHVSRIASVLLLPLPLSGVALVVLGILSSISEGLSRDIIPLCICFAFGVLIVCLYIVLLRTRLVLTPYGIAYYGWGFRLYTPWYNVIGTGYKRYPGLVAFRKYGGLRLHQSARFDMTLQEGMQQGKAVIETDWWNPAVTMVPYANIFLIDKLIGASTGKKAR